MLRLRLGLLLQLRFPAAAPKLRLLDRSVLLGAALDFAREPAFGDIAFANAVGMLLEQGNDLLNAPAAAEIVPDDGVKGIAAVGAVRGALPHDLLDFINAVLRRRSGSDAARRLALPELLLVLLRPHNGAIKQRIDGAELLAVAELQPRYGERLAGAPE